MIVTTIGDNQNIVKFNRWQRRICSLSVHSYVTSVNSVFVSDKIIKNSDSFRYKCLSYRENKFNFMCS